MAHLDLAARATAANQIRQAGLVLSDSEAAAIEIADFGLGRYDELGLAIHVYVNTARCCAKELAMLPNQMCPEHLHPPVDDDPGKEETFRVRQGEVHLFVAGDNDSTEAQAFAESFVPADKKKPYRHIATYISCLAINTPWLPAPHTGLLLAQTARW